jgi:hypothetical protein
MKTEEELIQIVLKECHKLEDILNKDLLPEFIRMHRANPKYNALKLKQEVLASNAVFFTKKKYGLFIKNKEGKTVSEFDLKGLVIRRSNFPVYTKEKVQALLDMILKVEKININEIKQFIVDTEKEVIQLCNQNSKLIAGSVNFSKPLSEYKGKPPYQVQAMILWNMLEYRTFAPGTKGYLFRINGIDPMKAPQRILDNMHLIGSKQKYMVLPAEEESLPDYYVCNVAEQLRFVWTDRVKEVLLALIQNNINSMDQVFQ